MDKHSSSSSSIRSTFFQAKLAYASLRRQCNAKTDQLLSELLTCTDCYKKKRENKQ